MTEVALNQAWDNVCRAGGIKPCAAACSLAAEIYDLLSIDAERGSYDGKQQLGLLARAIQAGIEAGAAAALTAVNRVSHRCEWIGCGREARRGEAHCDEHPACRIGGQMKHLGNQRHVGDIDLDGDTRWTLRVSVVHNRVRVQYFVHLPAGATLDMQPSDIRLTRDQAADFIDALTRAMGPANAP